jgi:hypothetical protein
MYETFASSSITSIILVSFHAHTSPMYYVRVLAGYTLLVRKAGSVGNYSAREKQERRPPPTRIVIRLALLPNSTSAPRSTPLFGSTVNQSIFSHASNDEHRACLAVRVAIVTSGETANGRSGLFVAKIERRSLPTAASCKMQLS